MNTELFKQYRDVKMKISSLEDEAKVLNSAILGELQKAGKDKEEFDFGKFSVATRNNYKYTEKVEEMEEKVKLAKLKEVEKGIATNNKTSYLLFKESKNL